MGVLTHKDFAAFFHALWSFDPFPWQQDLLQRLLQIVGVLDVEVALDDLRLIPVRFADAVELARILNEFFAGRRVRGSPSPRKLP